MKTNQFLSLSAIFAIALTFFTCSSDSGDPPSGRVPSSDSGGVNQMVSCKLTTGNCSQMSLSTCMELVNAGEAQIVPDCTTKPSSSSYTPPPSSSSALAPNALEITLTRYEELGSLDPTGYGDPRISFQVLAYRQGTRLNNVTTGLLLNRDDIRIWTGSAKATVTISDLSDSVVVYPIVKDADVMSDDDVSPAGHYVKNFINGTTINDIESKNSKVSVTYSLRFIRR